MSSREVSSATRSPVLYDAQGLLIVDKPEGVLSHPNPKRGPQGSTPPRAAFEGAYNFDERSFQTPEGKIWLIHRLDQDTSGVLIAARSAPIARQMCKIFEDGGITKYYTALAAGRVIPAHGRWYDHMAIQKQKGRVRSRILESGPANAKLRYQVRTFYPKAKLSLLQIELLTGKTHQIRVQYAYRRWPIAGDEVYGDFALNKKLRTAFGLRRLFLHASRIGFKHPMTGEAISIEAPLPEALSRVLEKVR